MAGKVSVAALPQRSFNVDSAFPPERPEEAASAAAEVRVWLGGYGVG